MVPTGLMHGRLSRFSRRSRLASPANLDVCERFDPLQPSYTFVSLVSSKPGRQKVRPAASLVLTPCESAADSYAPPGSESESPAMAQGSTCCQTPLATTMSPSQLETSVEPPPQTSLITSV